MDWHECCPPWRGGDSAWRFSVPVAYRLWRSHREASWLRLGCGPSEQLGEAIDLNGAVPGVATGIDVDVCSSGGFGGMLRGRLASAWAAGVAHSTCREGDCVERCSWGRVSQRRNPDAFSTGQPAMRMDREGLVEIAPIAPLLA